MYAAQCSISRRFLSGVGTESFKNGRGSITVRNVSVEDVVASFLRHDDLTGSSSTLEAGPKARRLLLPLVFVVVAAIVRNGAVRLIAAGARLFPTFLALRGAVNTILGTFDLIGYFPCTERNSHSHASIVILPNPLVCAYLAPPYCTTGNADQTSK